MSRPFTVSKRVSLMHSSSTFKAALAAIDLRAEGHDVIDLTLGEPDFDTPEFVKRFAIEGLNQGLTKYTPSSGLRVFQESIAEFYAERFGTEVAPSSIVASCGGNRLAQRLLQISPPFRKRAFPQRHARCSESFESPIGMRTPRSAATSLARW